MLLEDDEFDLRRFLTLFERGFKKGCRIADAEFAHRFDPFAHDPHHLGALRTMATKIATQSHGISYQQALQLTNLLDDISAAIMRRYVD